MKVEIDGIEYKPVTPRITATTSVNTLGCGLRAFRSGLKLSLTAAAAEIGCSKGYLFALERDQSMPSLELARRISEAYGVPVATLAALTMQPNP